jgi:hypothetical protein
LPCNGAALKANPAFQRDDLAVVVLTSFPVAATLFDGGRAAGPVPIFFTAQPAEALQKLKSLPSLAHQLCQALATRLKTTEYLSAAEAADIGAVPRDGKTDSPFARVYTDLDPSPPKRQKEATQAEAASSSYRGIESIIMFINISPWIHSFCMYMRLCIIYDFFLLREHSQIQPGRGEQLDSFA